MGTRTRAREREGRRLVRSQPFLRLARAAGRAGRAPAAATYAPRLSSVRQAIYIRCMASETIQHFIETGDRLEAWCHNPDCRHHAVIDMVMLRDRLGSGLID